jgi:hypothetical protein
VISKFKTINVDTQLLPPVESASKSELLANLSHIKCPDDVVCLVNHHLYSPIGIHRIYPAQKFKIREQPDIDVNNNDSPLRDRATKEFGQSRLFPRYEKRELLNQKNEITKASTDFQQPVPLGDISRKSTIDKGKILIYENKFSLNSLTNSQKPENNANNKEATSTENSGERNEFRKRKRLVIEKPLSPHLSYINDSSKTIYIIKFESHNRENK